jgi:hypothetical protein
LEEDMQQGSSNRSSQASISAALAAANAALGGPGSDRPGSDRRSADRSGSDGAGLKVHFSHEDRGRSLAEMAQRDLDAALQLLTDRAQYITGSSGAAIALRRSGSNDMLCRASTGANAPELGTLLSTEFGLSGESVRTRRALRCDDAERDARVNHDVCREVGIASVVVMPVVHDDEVLGVFELFSGRAHAFGERDLSALRRLSEMVETAVRLARAAEGMPERWKSAAPAAEKAEGNAAEISGSIASGGHSELAVSFSTLATEQQVPHRVYDSVRNDNPRITSRGDLNVAGLNQAASHFDEPIVEVETEFGPAAKAFVAMTAEMPNICIDAPMSRPSLPADSPLSAAFNKPLFWSAAAGMSGEARKFADDRGDVPAVLRNLRKCDACGFPVTAERTLCVECEEKRWRGQLKPRASGVSGAASATAAAPAPERKAETEQKLSPSLAEPAHAAGEKEEKTGRPVSATATDSQVAPAKTLSAQMPAAQVQSTQPLPTEMATPSAASAAAPAKAPNGHDSTPSQAGTASGGPSFIGPSSIGPSKAAGLLAASSEAAPAVVFSAGLENSQSWLGRNKYVLGAMLVIAMGVAAILWLR